MNPIREAASRLPGHWIKGSLSDDKGNYCGIGHLSQVLDETWGDHWFHNKFHEYTNVYDILSEVAAEQYPERMSSMRVFPDFNDHPDTLEGEVVAVMEKAAVRLDEKVD